MRGLAWLLRRTALTSLAGMGGIGSASALWLLAPPPGMLGYALTLVAGAGLGGIFATLFEDLLDPGHRRYVDQLLGELAAVEAEVARLRAVNRILARQVAAHEDRGWQP